MLAPRRLNTALTATLWVAGVCALAGCGTTRSTDTQRTATEQLLISDAIDRAVQTVNFGVLAGQTVYLDDSALTDVVDRHYLVSTMRQHLLASGCVLREQRGEADFIVAPRAGAIGTDRNDLLFGVPSMNVPQVFPLQGVPAAIPEVPIAKRRDQRGIAKIAVYAYHRATGAPVWQSGIALQESSSNDVWILGAGPFQRGTIYEGTAFAGRSIRDDLPGEDPLRGRRRSVDLTREARFMTADRLAKAPRRLPKAQSGLVQAAHEEEMPVVLSPPNDPPVAPSDDGEPQSFAPPPETQYAKPLPRPRFDSP